MVWNWIVPPTMAVLTPLVGIVPRYVPCRVATLGLTVTVNPGLTTEPIDAVIEPVPADTGDITPEAETETMDEAELAQVEGVTAPVELSEYVPVAVSCCVPSPTVKVFVPVKAMLTRVAPPPPVFVALTMPLGT